MSIDATKHPQLAKMDNAQPTSHVIGEFLKWLSENGMFVGKHIRAARLGFRSVRPDHRKR